MRYQEKIQLRVTIDADQYHLLGKIADQRRSTISQVVRELLDAGVKQGEINERVGFDNKAVRKD